MNSPVLTMTPTWKPGTTAKEKDDALREAGRNLEEAMTEVCRAYGVDRKWKSFPTWFCDADRCEAKTRERGANGWTQLIEADLDFCPEHRIEAGLEMMARMRYEDDGAPRKGEAGEIMAAGRAGAQAGERMRRRLEALWEYIADFEILPPAEIDSWFDVDGNYLDPPDEAE